MGAGRGAGASSSAATRVSGAGLRGGPRRGRGRLLPDPFDGERARGARPVRAPRAQGGGELRPRGRRRRGAADRVPRRARPALAAAARPGLRSRSRHPGTCPVASRSSESCSRAVPDSRRAARLDRDRCAVALVQAAGATGGADAGAGAAGVAEVQDAADRRARRDRDAGRVRRGDTAAAHAGGGRSGDPHLRRNAHADRRADARRTSRGGTGCESDRSHWARRGGDRRRGPRAGGRR